MERVEPAISVVEAEDGVREVVLERQDGRAREEHHEAVEDEQVPKARHRVTPADPGVREDDLADPDRALAPVAELFAAASVAVLEEEAKYAVDEDRDREDDQRVP